MPKKQALIKRSNGNISITIENNLKADQNAVQQTRRRRKKRTDVAGGGVGGTAQEILRGGGSTTKIGGTQPPPPSQKPYIDVSYIRPPPQSYSIWNDTTVADPNNVGVGYSQAQQMGLIDKQPTRVATKPSSDPIVNYPPIREGIPVIEEIPEGIPVDDELQQSSTWIPIDVEDVDDSQKSRYVENETQTEKAEDYEPRYTNKQTRIYVGSNPLERYPSENASRYEDEEPAWMRTNDSPEENYSTDSDFEAAAKRLFPKPKRGRPKKKLTDEQLSQKIDEEYFKEGVKYAKQGIEIPPEEFANAPTPFLKGYNSVSSSAAERDDDEEVIFNKRLQGANTTPKPQKPKRNRKQPERFRT
jgi:hypothetical protein